MRGALVVALLLLVAPRRAGADHDHHGGGGEAIATPAHQVEATASVDGAQLLGGSYQGVTASLAWRWRRLGAAVALPWYRLQTTARTAVGLGDTVVQAEARVLDARALRIGLVVAISLPTGDADDRLGMGHAMAMPGAWLIGRRGKATLLISASIGKSLGADAGHQHAPALVSPMNQLEACGVAQAGLAVTPSLSIHASGALAEPIDEGVRRASVGAGTTVRRGAWTLTSELRLGVAGDPYRIRAQLALGRTF